LLSIDPLHKPAMLLGPLCYIVNHIFVSIVTPAMLIAYISQSINEQGWMVKVLNPPQNFEHLPHGTSGGIHSLLHFKYLISVPALVVTDIFAIVCSLKLLTGALSFCYKCYNTFRLPMGQSCSHCPSGIKMLVAVVHILWNSWWLVIHDFTLCDHSYYPLYLKGISVSEGSREWEYLSRE
jgi:hypothetical protein